MGNENIESNSLSEEQLEQQEKFAELSDIMLSIRDVIDKSEHASDEAQEVAASMQRLINEFKKKGLILEDYLLGKIFLSKSDVVYDPNLPFDENGKIGEAIKELRSEQNKRLPLEEAVV